MMVWLKFLHMAAIAIWCAGLIGLPGLYLQRTHIGDQERLYRLQHLVRFFYVSLISPAAFVAIASGTALIFLSATFSPWFSLKLGLVGGLVTLHILTGLVIIRLFEDDQVYPVWRFLMVTLVTLLLVAAILLVVLLKPAIDMRVFDEGFFEPGALRDFADSLIAWLRR